MYWVINIKLGPTFWMDLFSMISNVKMFLQSR